MDDSIAYNAALRAENMRVIQKALTFDDVLLLPAHSRVLPREVSLKTRLTRKLQLNLPIVSAAMDTVTEARLAIAMAQEGGIGIIHKNFSIQAQAAEVQKVKRFESGVLRALRHGEPDRRAGARRRQGPCRVPPGAPREPPAPSGRAEPGRRE